MFVSIIPHAFKKGITFVRYLYRSFLTYSKEYKLYDELKIGSYLKPANLVIFPPPLIGIWQIMYANMLRFSFAFFSLTIIDISYLF